MFNLFLNAIGQVLLVGVVVGAGLPALFATGVRWLAEGAGGDAEESHAAGKPLFTVLGYLCFAVVLAVIALGIAIVVSSGFGYSVNFDHIVPAFVKKGH